jgi:hypothetical protein
MDIEISIIILINYVIFAYLYVFTIQNSFMCEYCMCHIQHVVLA